MKVTSFTIKGFPFGLYRKFKTRCAEKGLPMKTVIINLLTKFVEGK